MQRLINLCGKKQFLFLNNATVQTLGRNVLEQAKMFFIDVLNFLFFFFSPPVISLYQVCLSLFPCPLFLNNIWQNSLENEYYY